MIEDEQLHITNYVIDNFRHLLTKTEQDAVGAFVFNVKEKGDTRLAIYVRGMDEPTEEIKSLLIDGMQSLRRRLADKLIQDHREEVFANSCPKCGKLPRTPKAKQCPWCFHSWRVQ
jgi:hypothetical protein